MAIDRAVLLPGQELMERMDREYGGKGSGGEKHLKEEIEKVRTEEEGAQGENKEEGQDPEQGASGRMHQDSREEDAAQTA